MSEDEEESDKKKKKKKKQEEFSGEEELTSIPMSKSFKKIEDLLQIESANVGMNDPAFDENVLEEERKKFEERKQKLLEFKKELTKLKDLPNDGYMDTVTKMLVEKGLSMLDALQQEIEDSPRGRDVETAAAMMSAINGLIDNIHKQKIYAAKIDIEKQKLELKKAAGAGNIPYSATQNNFFVGSTTDLIDMLQGKKPFPDQEIKDAKDVKILKDDELEKQ